jgi:dihydrolipoamide dehydrogenase
MFKQLIPRASARRTTLRSIQHPFAASRLSPSTSLLQDRIVQRRGYATPSGKLHPHITFSNFQLANVFQEEKDLVIIGGGVAGYVAAIKAGQEGLKVLWNFTAIL